MLKIRSKSKSKSVRLLKNKKKNKKSVQFADGIKPGEGTSPSGGEGDMPSPPPPTAIGFRDGLKDLKRDKLYSSRKNRKEKRARPPKTKKKVKVSKYHSIIPRKFRERGMNSKIFYTFYSCIRYITYA